MGLDGEARELSELAELAMAARERGAFREQLLDALARGIGFDKASVHAFRADTDVDTHARGYERPEAFAELPAFMSELEPHEIAVASEGKPIVDVETLSARRRERLALYQRFLRPERVTVYTTVMWRAERGVAGINLARTGRGARFTARELAKLERWLPTIRLADALVTLRAREAELPSFVAWAEHAELSAREREVTALVVRGLANGEIAALLRVSPHTVRNQLVSVFRKADVSTRAELVFVATTFAPAWRDPQRASWTRYVR